MANNSEEKNYTTKDYGNLTLVELKFQEMRREVERINEIVNDVKSNLKELVNAINKLAGLVEMSTIPTTSATIEIDLEMKKIWNFVTTQIERYASLNEFTVNQIRKLDDLLMELFDEDGQLITYEIDGKEVTESFTKLLKSKESETAITNSSAEGYRVYNGSSEKIKGDLAVSEDRWENFETIYTYFMKKGLTDEQISGILSNVANESGFDKDAKNPTSAAKGLFQWLDNRYPESWDIESQLDHAWDEMENVLIYNGKTTLSRIQNCTTPEEASNVFLEYFGGAGPENYETNDLAGLYPTRRTDARDIYNYIQKMKAESTY